MAMFGGNLALEATVDKLQLPSVMAAPAPPKKGGLFGSGKGLGEIIPQMVMGYLAARGNPVGMFGLKQMQLARQEALDEQQYQQRRGDKIADYAEMQKIQAQYGAPPAPHYFESNSGDVYSIAGPGQSPQQVFKDPFRYKMVPNGLGGVVPVSIEALMGGGQQPPQTLSDDDWPTQGGPPPQGAGGFPRSY